MMPGPGEAPLPVDELGDLLASITKGDGAAFAEFYRLTSARVFGVVRKVVVNHPISEEVTQEVFLEIWSKAASFDADRGSALSWVMTMARRRAIDRVRSEAAATGRIRAWARAEQLADFDTVLEDVLAADETRHLSSCLERLTPLQREAIDLAYFGGLTYNEVAEQLGAASGTVKSRIREGIIRLRTELTPVGM
jgi:RNA polymerase sigma-70 factor (ECF subfamily)